MIKGFIKSFLELIKKTTKEFIENCKSKLNEKLETNTKVSNNKFVKFVINHIRLTSFVVSGLLIFILLICFNFSFTGQRLWLEYYGNNKNSNKLIEYISKNYAKSNHIELVELAIDEIVKNNDNEGIKYLDDLFMNDAKESNELKDYTVELFNENNIKFNDCTMLCKYYINNKDIDNNVKNQLSIMIEGYSNEEIDGAFINILGDLYNKNDYSNFINVINIYNTENFGSNSVFSNLQNLLEKKQNNQKSINDLDNQLKDINTKIDSCNKEIDDTKKTIDDINKKETDLQSTISTSQGDLNSKSNYKNIRFYVIAQNDDKSYEIALSTYNRYYGEYPSDDHSILITNDTAISSKGWGNMDVYDKGMVDVKLKENYGGFTQQWHEYVQVSQSDKNSISSLQAQINDAKNKLQDDTKQVNDLSKKAVDIANNDTKSLNNSKDQLLAKQKELKGIDVDLNKQITSLLGISVDQSSSASTTNENSTNTEIDYNSIAKKTLKDNIIKVIPFTETGKNYIAVLHSSRISILSSEGTEYKEIWKKDFYSIDDAAKNIFEVKDINGDGNLRVCYGALTSMGSHVWIAVCGSYSVLDNHDYHIDFDNGGNIVDIDASLKTQPKIEEYLNKCKKELKIQIEKENKG